MKVYAKWNIKCNNLNRKIEKTNYWCENTGTQNNLRIVSTYVFSNTPTVFNF